MMKVFTKVSVFILAASLLCNMVPAMALGTSAKGAVKVAPGIFCRMRNALPTWTGTKAVFVRMASSRPVKAVANATKKAAVFVNNHRMATMGVIAATAAICYGYKVARKYFEPISITKAEQLRDMENAAIIALKNTNTSSEDYAAKSKTRSAARSTVKTMADLGPRLSLQRDAFIAEWERQITLSNKTKNPVVQTTELERMVTQLTQKIGEVRRAEQLLRQKTGASNATAGATAAANANAQPAADVDEQIAVYMSQHADATADQAREYVTAHAPARH